MITVYGAPPTRALRVIWMLEEMGLPYQVRPVDFAKRHQDAEFMDVSPAGAIPAMKDGEVRMVESCAITEYLGARYGPTPLIPSPADPAYPAYLSFLHFGEASLAAPLNVTVGSRFFAPDDQKRNWGASFAIDLFLGRSAALVRALRDKPYVAGDAFTAADISCGFAIGVSRLLGFFDRLDPILAEYFRRLTERPAYGRAAAHSVRL